MGNPGGKDERAALETGTVDTDWAGEGGEREGCTGEWVYSNDEKAKAAATEVRKTEECVEEWGGERGK